MVDSSFIVFLIYNALHLPVSIIADERTQCTLSIDAACLWPLFLALPTNKKHLVSHSFLERQISW
jgi:hypothetical protein